MSIEDEITAWAATRPVWNTQVLQALMTGAVISDETVASIADHLVDGSPVALAPALPVPAGAATTGTNTVTIHGISNTQDVNALARDQHLTFAPAGVTVVYGENGSGKSGYARLLKSAVRARHREDVLPDIFAEGVGSPSAVVHFAVDDAEDTCPWPGGSRAVLRQVSFYDEACGDSYVTSDMELTYRPAALAFMDQLIGVSDAVRTEVERRLSKNAAATKALPHLKATTTAGQLLARLSAATSPQAIDDLVTLLEGAANLPADVAERLIEAEREHVRLRASDPALERKRYTDAAARRETVANHIRALDGSLGTTAMDRLNSLAATAAELRAAATVASSSGFGAEPVPGVGSSTWRALWEAARAFSEAEAYPGHAFPVADEGDTCVLCHQQLDEPARGRLSRFEAFVRDDTSRRAQAAEGDLRQAVDNALAREPLPSTVEAALQLLDDLGDPSVTEARTVLAAFAQRHELLKTWDRSAAGTHWGKAPGLGVAETLLGKARQDRESAAGIDDGGFAASLDRAAREHDELQASVEFSAEYDNVVAEVTRRREQSRLEAARRATDTSGITRKSTELARVFVTDVVRDRFTRELDRLHLDRVTLRDTGGRKGQLLHRPAFLGSARNVALDTVLSEGEQTALGLAGFFTEAYFDSTKSALVFDDPISSLDANRRRYVAERLVQLAADRQVVVFTHDSTFAAELRRASQDGSVPFTPRSVERSGAKTPGICQDRHPWDLKDIDDRFKWLETRLTKIRSERADLDFDDYDEAVSLWAGRLSMTWERILTLEVAGRIFDRGTMQVKPMSFRMLVQISQEDDDEFQRSYGQCSEWAARHDKSAELNYSPPEPSELQAELDKVKAWRKKIKKYLSV
ncbi:AAA family ATPase [Modestobacter sp. VKM Ac-2978]|uniref:AAA family ATPase n=1 Tax=Modestobacter sp. VKM Ac-2978 TaxID=3004132 RepID=UPI0022AB23A6|nr:hypothetical protein [Modestobacter sp. VKM Ac-2978]MCZ2847417.1 hypothetical protein [Modestobacter sp. VKM Ac-2978]